MSLLHILLCTKMCSKTYISNALMLFKNVSNSSCFIESAILKLRPSFLNDSITFRILKNEYMCNYQETKQLIKGLTGPVFLGCKEASAGTSITTSTPLSSPRSLLLHDGSCPGPSVWYRGRSVYLPMSTSCGEHRSLQSVARPRTRSASTFTSPTT